ncbi:hypothetical protein [Moorena producens]
MTALPPQDRNGAFASIFVHCSLFPVPCSLFPVPCSLFPLVFNRT